MRRELLNREVVWGRSPRRTAAPNESEPLDRPNRSGERASQRDAQNPTETGAVMRGRRRDIQCSYPGRSARVRESGRREEGNDDLPMPLQKSDLFVRAMKPVKAG